MQPDGVPEGRLKPSSLDVATHLLVDVVSGGDGSGELSSSVKMGSDDLGDGLNQRLGGDEGVVLSAQLLDKLLVLVELLQVINVEVEHSELLGSVLVVSITDDSNLEAADILVVVHRGK
eukprot:gene16331-biopygen4589